MKILLLEDDDSYRISIKEYLEYIDFTVDDFDNGSEALQAAFEGDYDLLLLDVQVPGITGHQLAQEIRDYGLDVPIIFVTSLIAEEDVVLAYEIGCNDYIRKPFSLKELQYRITQSINASKFKTNKKMIDLKFDYGFVCERKELMFNDEVVNITKKELKILQFLLQRQGAFATINEIISEVWEDEYISDADLRMHIKRLRDKTHKELIINARGHGYKIERA